MFVYMIRLKVWCAVYIHVDLLVIEKCFIQGQSRSDRWSHYPNPNRKINSCTHPFKHSDFSLSFICLCDWTLFSLSLALQLSFSLHKLLFDLCRFPFYFDVSLLLFGIYCKCLRVNCKWFCGFLVFADRLSHSIRWKKKKTFTFNIGLSVSVWVSVSCVIRMRAKRRKNQTETRKYYNTMFRFLSGAACLYALWRLEYTHTWTFASMACTILFWNEKKCDGVYFSFYCCGGFGCFAFVTTIVCCASLTS